MLPASLITVDDAYLDDLAEAREFEQHRQMYRDLHESNNVILHQHYIAHGKAGEDKNTLRRQLPAAPAKAFGAFQAFEASLEGKTVWVSGYTRKNGRQITGYFRRPARRYEWIGVVGGIGTQSHPLLVG